MTAILMISTPYVVFSFTPVMEFKVPFLKGRIYG